MRTNPNHPHHNVVAKVFCKGPAGAHFNCAGHGVSIATTLLCLPGAKQPEDTWTLRCGYRNVQQSPH